MSNVVTIKQHDSRVLEFLVNVDLTGATALKFLAKETVGGAAAITSNAVLGTTSPVLSKVLVTLVPSDTALARTLYGELEVTMPGGFISTFPSYGYVRLIITPDLG